MNILTPVLSAAAGVLIMAGLGCSSSSSSPAHARGGPSPTPVIRNPEFLEQYSATKGFTHGTPKNISITPDGSAVLFLRSGPRSFVQDLFSVDTATGQERTLLTADQILSGKEEHLTAEELARRERMRLASRGIASYSLSKDGKQILVPLSGRLFVVDRLGGGIKELKSAAGYPIDPQFSPDGTMIACVREGDLYVTNLATGAETRLTTKSSPTITNGLAEFVAQEEMDRFRGFWWSPDSKQIAYEQADTAGMETFHIADPVSPDKTATEWPYPRPGRANAKVRMGVISAAGGNTLWMPWDHSKYEYVAAVSWAGEPGSDAQLLITVMNRAQTEVAVLWHTFDPVSPRDWTSAAFTESDPAWVNLVSGLPRLVTGWSSGLFTGDAAKQLDPRLQQLMWLSEVDGDKTLMLHSFPPALGPQRVVSPGLGVQGIAGVQEQSKTAYLLASTDPTQTQVYRITAPASASTGAPGIRGITSAPGVHGVILSEKSDVCVCSAALLNGQTTWEITSGDRSRKPIPIKLTRESPPWTPNLQLTTCGSRDFHAAVIRPRDFKPGAKYPVIVSVYGGPHHQMVRASPELYFREQWMADQGFIVCCIDGRGTPNRGRDWERAIKNDLINPALDDQVDGLKSLGAKYPEMDLTRVGIYGWSFGGYFSAMAAMKRPDIFKAACAGAPVCDWLDYDTCYTERYLGVPPLDKDGQPNSEIYTKSSVLTYCKDLQVPLLIIHGTADDNVYFMHSLKMTQSLFRAGKDFDFLPLAGFTHMVPDPVVTTRLYSRIAMFFMEKLGGVK